MAFSSGPRNRASPSWPVLRSTRRRLSRDLPEALAEKFPGLTSDAQRAIQFTRSTPGIAVALVGMSHAAHVAENLGVAAAPPLTPSQYLDLFQRA